MIRGDPAEAALLEARRGARARARHRLRRRPRRRSIDPACRDADPGGAQASPPDVRGGRLGAGRIGDRRSARRSALAVRIGRGHRSSSSPRSISALGATSAADLAPRLREQAIRAVPGWTSESEAAVAAALPTLRARDSAHPARPRRRRSPTDPRSCSARHAGRRLGARRRLAAPRAGHRSATSRSSRRRDDPAGAIDELLALPAIGRVLHGASAACTCCSTACRSASAFRVRQNAGAALLHLTGSPRISPRCALATDRRLALTPGRPAIPTALVAAATEDEIYARARPALHPAGDPKRRRRDPRRRATARCRAASPAPTSAAICTCTRRGATAATRSRRWSRRAARSATSTWRSPTTRRTRPHRAT